MYDVVCFIWPIPIPLFSKKWHNLQQLHTFFKIRVLTLFLSILKLFHIHNTDVIYKFFALKFILVPIIYVYLYTYITSLENVWHNHKVILSHCLWPMMSHLSMLLYIKYIIWTSVLKRYWLLNCINHIFNRPEKKILLISQWQYFGRGEAEQWWEIKNSDSNVRISL